MPQLFHYSIVVCPAVESMDTVSKSKRSEIMRAIKSRDSKIELAVRGMLHKAGFRFRLHRKNLPGNPDLVFPGRKKVVFVHGCFWHQHPDPNCRISHRPLSNTNYWHPKLERTLKRDAKNLITLRGQGWQTLVIWECQMRDKEALLRTLINFLSEVLV